MTIAGIMPAGIMSAGASVLALCTSARGHNVRIAPNALAILIVSGDAAAERPDRPRFRR